MVGEPSPITTLKVRVQPKASKNEVLEFQGDLLRLRVTAAPEAGKANKAVVALVAATLGIVKGHVNVERGHTSRNKLLSVATLTDAEVRIRLESRDSR